MIDKDIFGIILAAIIIGAIIWFFMVLPPKPTYQGQNMAQWLKKLRTDTNSIDDPLKIIRITKYDKSGNVEFELPLSYDLLKKYDFFERHGKIHLMIGEKALSTYCERATNGNLILGCDINDFTRGTNQVRAVFFIFNPSNKERFLHAESPPAEFVSDKAIYIHPKIFTGRDNQIILWAELSVSNADYSIDLLDTNNNSIKTFTEHTSDGTINEQWNLIGDSGKIYPRDAFGVIYHVAVSNLSGIITQDYKIQSP